MINEQTNKRGIMPKYSLRIQNKQTQLTTYLCREHLADLLLAEAKTHECTCIEIIRAGYYGCDHIKCNNFSARSEKELAKTLFNR